MIWLLLSILCSVLIFVVFRAFAIYRVDNLQAIVFNYVVAFSAGQWQRGRWPNLSEISTQPWLLNVLVLGFLFITLFQLMAWVSQNLGVTAVSIAVKMSVIIPIAFGLFYLGQPLTWLKALGFILALLALILSVYKPRQAKKTAINNATLAGPVILFLGSGFLDAFINYTENSLVSTGEEALFASSIFGIAFIFGLLFILFRALRGKLAFSWRNLLGGVALGLPNYGSIYFLIRALRSDLPSANVFALNNVGIVALSTIVGLIGFKEYLSPLNRWGLFLALIAIFILYLAQ